MLYKYKLLLTYKYVLKSWESFEFKTDNIYMVVTGSLQIVLDNNIYMSGWLCY